jgi:proline racemase/trans-L-3-hydroxyproline dehydratase
MATLRERHDDLRRALMLEPRGHRDMFGCILVPPADPQADLGVVFMDGDGYLSMCGHGSIGAVTVALEMGLIRPEEPETSLVLDTPAGLVRARASVEGGSVTGVSIENVPAFLYRQGERLDVPGIGTVFVDVAFGGNFFALVAAEALGLAIVPEQVRPLVDAGMRVLARAREALPVQHPTLEHFHSIDLVEIHGRGPSGAHRNIVVFGQGQFDRSPCGTGTCARMAALHAKRQLALGDEFIHESVIGTTFTGRLLRETQVGDLPAVVPEIAGRAFITGFQQFVLDPDDPLRNGFLVG